MASATARSSRVVIFRFVVSPSTSRRTPPAASTFGYYGYYFDLKTFEKVVVYASEWKNLVEIVDIYEQRYYVSCTQADELVALLQSE